jgi:hypothetical protein
MPFKGMVGELLCPLHSIIRGFQVKVKRILSNIHYFTVVFLINSLSIETKICPKTRLSLEFHYDELDISIADLKTFLSSWVSVFGGAAFAASLFSFF